MVVIVVDASVAAKWVLAESDREAAKALLTNGERLIAPSLIRFEVTGAIIRRFRNNAIDENAARAAYVQWDDLLRNESLDLLPAEELMTQAFDFALHARHGLADCLYVAAAKTYGAEMITADVTLRERGLKLYPRIALLTPSPH